MKNEILVTTIELYLCFYFCRCISMNAYFIYNMLQVSLSFISPWAIVSSMLFPSFSFFKYYVFKHSSWLMLFRHLNLPWIWAKTWMVVRTRTLNMPCMIIYSVRGIAAPVSLPQLLECIVPNLVEPVVVKETTQCAGHQMGWQLMRSLR